MNNQRLTIFNKPFNVLCQFTDSSGRATLADYISAPGVYPAGRLDFDSEGLLVLTDAGFVQHLIADPRHKLPKTYLQVRRMTAAVGHPTLRLIRERIGPWSLGDLKPGEWRDARRPGSRDELMRMMGSSG